MRSLHAVLWALSAGPGLAATAAAQQPMRTPADGHTIHVLAPHVVDGQVAGPFHHYCKVISPEPVIECLIYLSTDSLAPLSEIEYIVAKTLTRTDLVSLADWNKNWHDHAQEISTRRVQVLDLPPDQAKEVADLVAKTDGIIFHLWPHGWKIPTGKVTIAQSVGHVNITMAEKMSRGR
ncbi:MAG: DUF1264 domain-containing protein [Gemmatimonadetes bacterium]|nr:DUF1264 domain-containing protein [Gemmatimonadota bacterium]